MLFSQNREAVMNYTKIVISIDEVHQEILISELMELEFDAFEQQEQKLITYLPEKQLGRKQREHIEDILELLPGDGRIISEELVAEQNWNEQWEESIEPLRVGRFFVKPSWSDSDIPPDAILLEIDPKMSFGTGYHETTRLMLEFLPDLVHPGARVLDAGTGTGILSIAAVKIGAGGVFAFDIDEWSIENTRENIRVNGVEGKIEVRKGSEKVIPDTDLFDLIMANIERNTILDMLPKLNSKLAEGGSLLVSGLLQKDERQIKNKSEQLGLDYADRKRENEWIALHFKK